jgi:hypothetical protein
MQRYAGYDPSELAWDEFPPDLTHRRFGSKKPIKVARAQQLLDQGFTMHEVGARLAREDGRRNAYQPASVKEALRRSKKEQ